LDTGIVYYRRVVLLIVALLGLVPPALQVDETLVSVCVLTQHEADILVVAVEFVGLVLDESVIPVRHVHAIEQVRTEGKHLARDIGPL